VARATRCLELGQHMLSASAFDAAIELAQSRGLLLSEALSVRGAEAVGHPPPPLKCFYEGAYFRPLERGRAVLPPSWCAR
jgi:hypothetical protein